jgi:membrane fusion protein, multidrug efflux system
MACSENIAPSKPSSAAPAVKTLIVQAQHVPVTFTYVAQAQSSHLVNIQARVNGFLDKRVYTEGSFVKKDDILFIMDKKPFEAQVAAEQAALARQKAAHHNAKLNLDRVQPLVELNALSQKELDDAIGTFESTAAAVAQAEAQLETALLNLSYCTIFSPLDGVTSYAEIQEGSYLHMMDSKLTTVSVLDPIWVNFSLSDNELQNIKEQVKKGLLLLPKKEEFKITIITVNDQAYPYKGTITFREPYYNVNTGTFLIRVSLPNPHGVLRPHQYVRAQVEGAIRPHAMVVPQEALFQSAKGMYVWVIDEENKAQLRPVVVGDWQDAGWFINEGLFSGDQVVVDGGIHLSPGLIVMVTP